MASEYRKAVEAFNKAVSLDYRESKVFNNLAVALASLERYDEALDAFVNGGGEAQAYNNLGCIYLQKEKYREAVKCFEKAIELEPSFYAKASDNLKKARKGSITQFRRLKTIFTVEFVESAEIFFFWPEIMIDEI